MKLNFKLDQAISKKANKIYLLVNYYGGDADTEHPEQYLLPFKYSDLKTNLELLEKEVKTFKSLKNILDVNHSDYCTEYKDIESKFGKEMASLFDNTPNDPQGDYQFKCAIDDLQVVAYDKTGNKYKAYIN